jgi:diguanylate cyclase (GGDEF)-like protein
MAESSVESTAESEAAVVSPMRDARQRFVQRSALLLHLLAAGAAAMIAVLHWLEPAPMPLNQFMPAVLSLTFLALAWRQWRAPQRLVSTLWIAWCVLLVGLATPVWYFTWLALQGQQSLVGHLPPVGAVFLPVVLVMALFAQPRHALLATLVAWPAIGAPVIGYLLTHPSELWSPRGLDLALALGPMALIVPLLVPVMRGVEERFQALRQEGERLQALAERDVLIGLYNRRAGERFLSTLLAHARDDAALILFDIDHFKRINDNFGHPAGDAVLIEVGKRCAAQLGRDDILARWGGEEFLVVLPSVPADQIEAVAERLRGAIDATPIDPVGPVSASFGVTSVQPQDTLGEVLQRVDDALYRAKAAGRNCVIAI